MKKGFFELTYDLLRQALVLPDGITIESATHDPKRDCAVIVVSGDSLPDSCAVREGVVLQRVQPWLKRHIESEAWVTEFDRWAE